MTYQATYRAAGDGVELYSVDAEVTVKCRAEQTGGAYGVFEVDMPRGAAVPPHTEPWAKAFYVLHGRLSVEIDDDRFELAPGAFVSIPPDTANSFRALTPSVKFLAFSPGDRLGNFFADIDRSVPRDAAFDELMPKMLELTGRHGVRMLEQPVAAS